MNGLHGWLIILGMIVATLSVRASFLVFGQHLKFPDWAHRALRYVPASVLPALIVPMAIAPEGTLWLSPLNPYLVGTVVAALVAYATKRTLTAILISFVVYGLMRWLM